MAPTDAAFLAWAKATLDVDLADGAAMIEALPGVLAGDGVVTLVTNLVFDHVVSDVTAYEAALKANGLTGCGVENAVIEVATLGPNMLKLQLDGEVKMVKQTLDTADITVGDSIQRLNGYVVVLSSVLDTFGLPVVTSAPTAAPTVTAAAAPIRSFEAAWVFVASLALCVAVSI